MDQSNMPEKSRVISQRTEHAYSTEWEIDEQTRQLDPELHSSSDFAHY